MVCNISIEDVIEIDQCEFRISEVKDHLHNDALFV